MKIGIIGGGAAGMASALSLVRNGHRVILYERAPFLGGHASTFEIGGARLERGYHHWFTNDTDIVELVETIGLGDRIRWIDSSVGTLYEGQLYDFVTPLDLLRFSPIGILDRIRLGLMTLYLQRQSDWRRYEGITASQWLEKIGGKQTYDVFWRPMLRGKFGEEHYEQIGMTWLWGKIQTRFASRGRGLAREKLGYPIGSFGEIFDVLAEKIVESGGEIHLSSVVKKIMVEKNHLSGLEIAINKTQSKFEPFEAIISTTPSHVFPNLLPSLPDAYRSKLTNVKYMSAVIIVLVLDRPLSHVYWMNVADRSIPFVAVIEHTNLISPTFYGGRHIVYLSNYVSPDHKIYLMDHDELIKEYLPHLRKINKQFDPSWIETSYHHKVDYAQPVIGINYSSQIPSHRTPYEGVYLANTTQIYPEDRGTNYSVRMGVEVAQMLMQDMS